MQERSHSRRVKLEWSFRSLKEKMIKIMMIVPSIINEEKLSKSPPTPSWNEISISSLTQCTDLRVTARPARDEETETLRTLDLRTCHRSK